MSFYDDYEVWCECDFDRPYGCVTHFRGHEVLYLNLTDAERAVFDALPYHPYKLWVREHHRRAYRYSRATDSNTYYFDLTTGEKVYPYKERTA